MHEFSIPDTVSGFFGLKEYICTINKEINIYIFFYFILFVISIFYFPILLLLKCHSYSNPFLVCMCL